VPWSRVGVHGPSLSGAQVYRFFDRARAVVLLDELPVFAGAVGPVRRSWSAARLPAPGADRTRSAEASTSCDCSRSARRVGVDPRIVERLEITNEAVEVGGADAERLQLAPQLLRLSRRSRASRVTAGSSGANEPDAATSAAACARRSMHVACLAGRPPAPSAHLRHDRSDRHGPAFRSPTGALAARLHVPRRFSGDGSSPAAEPFRIRYPSSRRRAPAPSRVERSARRSRSPYRRHRRPRAGATSRPDVAADLLLESGRALRARPGRDPSVGDLLLQGCPDRVADSCTARRFGALCGSRGVRSSCFSSSPLGRWTSFCSSAVPLARAVPRPPEAARGLAFIPSVPPPAAEPDDRVAIALASRSVRCCSSRSRAAPSARPPRLPRRTRLRSSDGAAALVGGLAELAGALPDRAALLSGERSRRRPPPVSSASWR